MEKVSRSMIPPTHFRLKIGSFSSLATSSIQRFESCEFDGGDYKWKLALYPNGNKEKGGRGEDHISLYLVLADSSCAEDGILVSFSLFVYDHIRDKCLSAQGVSPFSGTQCEQGFDKFLSLKVFNDHSNGYLVGNACMFGAEIFYIQDTIKRECLLPKKIEQVPCKYTWKIERFSELKDKCHESETFTTKGNDWKLLVYPKGHNAGKGISLSLYLALADVGKLSPGMGVPVQFCSRVLDQVNKNHQVKKREETILLSATNKDWGWNEFMPLSKLNSSTGYLVNDTCIVEVEFVN